MIDFDDVLDSLHRDAGNGYLLHDEIEAFVEKLREAEKDAARYRWLRDRVCMFYVSAEGCESKDAYLTVTGYGDDDSGASVDHAVDEQMKEKGDERENEG